MITFDDALALVDGFNDKFKSAVPDGHLGIRVIDMEKIEIVQDILVLDTPADREEMALALVVLTLLPPKFLILTNVA